MGNRIAAINNLKKAWKSDRIGDRGLGAKTMDRLKRKEMLDQKLNEYWQEINDGLIEYAQRDFNALKYAIDQGVGKPVENIDLKSDGKGFEGLTVTLPPKLPKK